MLFGRISELVQKLQVAGRELGLEAAISRLDRSQLVGGQVNFDPNLRRFVLIQYHQAQSTLPRLMALL